MKKLLSYLAHPVLLPLIPTAILVMIIPFNFDRYLLEVDQLIRQPERTITWFEDLTGDGNSERIQLRDLEHFSWVVIQDQDHVVFDQWNFYGHMRFLHRTQPLIAGDYDDDGKKELYFFTISSDSLFLHMIHDLSQAVPGIRNRFITTVGPGRGAPDPRFIDVPMTDLNQDGHKELVFGIGSGFSIFPRNLFAYFIEQDSLVRSPEKYYHITRVKTKSLPEKETPLFFVSGQSSSNVHPDEARYHDHSNWLMVLDENLEFVFEPVELPGRTNSLYPFVADRNQWAAVLLTWASGTPTTLYHFDQQGNITREHTFEIKARTAISATNHYGKNFLALANQDDGTVIYNANLKPVRSLPKVFLSPVYLEADITGDGNNELIVPDSFTNRLYVFRNGFSYLATIDLDYAALNDLFISVERNTRGPDRISVSSTHNHYMLIYRANPGYYFNFLYFMLIYAGLTGFAALTRKAQKVKLQKKYALEKKITELQLNLVKNQLDPHFALNVLNAINHSVRHQQNENASGMLTHFARMNKTLLLDAQSLQRSLGAELEFCTDYLELEKNRLNHSLEYDIRIDPGVDTGRLVPKMLIQPFVENAVKHGIAPKPGGGRIIIEVRHHSKGLDIIILDNGIGRKTAAGKKGASTGMGLGIMIEYYYLYQKYFQEQITSEITDLYYEGGAPAGTQVMIKINPTYDKKSNPHTKH